MAKDWIKMRVDLPSHPKVVRILSATKSDKFCVVGGLHAVWSVFDTHSIDGRLEGYTPETMDHIIGWEGFSGALINVGWLEYDGNETLAMPDFDVHNGQSAKRRAEETERKRKTRNSADSVRTDSGQSEDKKRSRGEERRGDKERPPKPPKGDDVPMDEIIDLYHKILPELPQAANYTDTRVKQLKARWAETATVPVGNGEFEKMACSSLDFWERYFRRVRTCPLLLGEKNGWHASLDWLTKKANFYKVIEGNYVE